MSIGTWEPGPSREDSSFEPDPALLEKFIDISQRDAFDEINELFSAEQLPRQSHMMRLPKEHWFRIAESFDNRQLIHLVRCFTLAEMRLPGWEAGADSPVVWLVKVLRKRANPPDQGLLRWIKANSTNKFLPNGALF